MFDQPFSFAIKNYCGSDPSPENPIKETLYPEMFFDVFRLVKTT